MGIYPVVRIKSQYGEFLTTADILDLAAEKYLPASVNDMRGVMTGITAVADDYAEVHSVSEFLIMVAATAPDLVAYAAPKPSWKQELFGEVPPRGRPY